MTVAGRTWIDKVLGEAAWFILPAVDSPKFGWALRQRVATRLFKFLEA